MFEKIKVGDSILFQPTNKYYKVFHVEENTFSITVSCSNTADEDELVWIGNWTFYKSNGKPNSGSYKHMRLAWASEPMTYAEWEDEY